MLKKIVSKLKNLHIHTELIWVFFQKEQKQLITLIITSRVLTYKNIYFFPGFPEMAWPMMDLILDNNCNIHKKIIERDYSVDVLILEKVFNSNNETNNEDFP